MLRETGSARVAWGPSGSGGTNGDMLRVVIAAAADEYEILGEMGHGSAGAAMVLARELATSQLVALRLDQTTSDDGSVFTVVRELDQTVPALGGTCPECGTTVANGGRFCTQCGASISLIVAPDEARYDSPAAASEAARRAAVGRYDIFGTMPRAGRAGTIYFARVIANGSLVALTLNGGATDGEGQVSPSLRVMYYLRPVDRPGSTRAASPETVGNDGDTLAPQPPRAQPTPHRAMPQQVLIPAGDTPPDENLPPRPVPRTRPWWIAPAALVVVVAVALGAIVKARSSLPDGTDARLGSGSMGVATAMPSHAGTVTPMDSAHIRIAAALPEGAEVTVDGIAIPSRSIALLPGEYLLAASAPGHVSVSETLRAGAGQTIVWTPTLPPVPTPARSKPTATASADKGPPTQPVATRHGVTSSTAPAPPPVETCASAYVAKNWTSAASLCASEARSGGVAAQRNLGVMYDRGLGVARDPTEAVAWLQKAAEAGSRDAAYQLATMFESGRGVAEDAARAITWYGKAALLGDRESQVKLAKAYEQGAGVPRDMGEALTWYRKAADQGDAWAQNYLGFLYGNGKGVRHDDAEALRWFRMSAAQGNGQAEYNVGFMYANGRGVARSDSTAVSWYRKSALHGYSEAEKELRRRGIRQ